MCDSDDENSSLNAMLQTNHNPALYPICQGVEMERIGSIKQEGYLLQSVYVYGMVP